MCAHESVFVHLSVFSWLFIISAQDIYRFWNLKSEWYLAFYWTRLFKIKQRVIQHQKRLKGKSWKSHNSVKMSWYLAISIAVSEKTLTKLVEYTTDTIVAMDNGLRLLSAYRKLGLKGQIRSSKSPNTGDSPGTIHKVKERCSNWY